MKIKKMEHWQNRRFESVVRIDGGLVVYPADVCLSFQGIKICNPAEVCFPAEVEVDVKTIDDGKKTIFTINLDK